MKRLLTIQIQNDVIGDGYFTPEVIKVLRSYADAMDAGLAGKSGLDRHEIEGGTILVATASNLIDEPDHAQGPQYLLLPDGSKLWEEE